MSDIAIHVENLGKKFIIGHQQASDLRNAFGAGIKRFFRPGSNNNEEFWALKDIFFEIKQGEAVGIIGRNGAGKSTLLKILSRIMEPTTGRFEINGRVSSLLEVGTGFHMELTGRENIYLNGTILGMKRAEIRAKFEEIVAFSGVEKFIDTPVKHYSSGMKVRLAFSVAAHLEPEILIVDEVLAVGDAEFQKKCLGKMDEVSKNDGRTVIFVSHNMAAVQNLCESGLLLRAGRLVEKKSIEEVISSYLSRGLHSGKKNVDLINNDLSITFSAIEMFSGGELLTNGSGDPVILFGEEAQFILHLKSNSDQTENLYVAITICDLNNIKVATLDNLYLDQPFNPSTVEMTVQCKIESFNLNPGEYYINLWSSDGFETIQNIERALDFEVADNNSLKTGKSHSKTKHGFIYFNQTWTQYDSQHL